MNTKTKKVGVLGYGETGKAIASFYKDPLVQDIAGPHFPSGVQLDILHVCIPFSNPTQFDTAVREVIQEHARGALVFIHSTVQVGTTKRIGEMHKHIVHAPLRGVHPNLAEGIRTFPMYIGADFAGAGAIAAEHLESIGITSVVLYHSAASELLKLLDTTYYGVCIAFHAYAQKLCQTAGVNFDMVMTEANRSYNAGYAELGKSNVIRPVLTPPEGGKIGGHCVVPNAELLRFQFGDDAILETILRHK